MEWIDKVYESRMLTLPARMVAGILWRDMRGNVMIPDRTSIAERATLSKRAMGRAIEELRTAGFVSYDYDTNELRFKTPGTTGKADE